MRVASVEISAPTTTLLIGPGGGQSTVLAATARSVSGAVLENREIVWSVQPAGIVSVSPAGLVTAIGIGTANVRATSEGKVGALDVTVLPVPVDSIHIEIDSLTLLRSPILDGAAQIVAVAYDTAGTVLVNRALTWESRNVSVVAVSAAGRVTAISTGNTYVVASASGKRDSVAVTVEVADTLPTGFDISITSALWTQASQNEEGTIPMLLAGRAAVVNVMTTAPAALIAPSTFELRIYGSDLALRWSARRNAIVRAGTSSSAAPTVQFLVPAAELAADIQWEVRWDPDELIPDADAATDVFPRNGRENLGVVHPPTLKLRFVPVSLTAHGSITGNVTSGNVDEYLRLIRQFGPVGAIEYTIAPPFAVGTSFGVPPSGGAATFWLALLQQLDLARVASAEYADAHWVGVVAPPVGFNNVTNGGYAYIPNNGASFGPATRTLTVVNAGWFFRESATRELMLHELGHNFGRQHAPCGGAPNADVAFPVAGGRTGAGGHDTYSYQQGLTTSAAAIDAGLGDVMGYCTPIWISNYSYDAMLQFRGNQIVALRERPARQRAVVVHGIADNAGNSELHRATLLSAVPDIAADAGDWEAVLYDVNDAEVGRRRFNLGRVDHLENQRPITVAFPLAGIDEARLKRIEVRSPSGRTSQIVVERDER